MPIEVRPITGALGAEIHGVDLGADLDAASVAKVRRALLDHCVVFFRDQWLDAAQQKALARRFGGIFVHPNYATVVLDPEIIEIHREPGDVRIVGEEWHTDNGHRPEFTCRFHWANGSVAFWDNRCVKHLAVHDAGRFRRIMRRVQIAGDKPV
jgi:alpha-ketoglutarate-dependent taurine dioxygenase